MVFIHVLRIVVAPPSIISIHSFTPVWKGLARPWHVALLWDCDPRLAKPLIAGLQGERDLIVGDNEPYAVSDATDYTIPVHGEKRGLMHTGIEIRQEDVTLDNFDTGRAIMALVNARMTE